VNLAEYSKHRGISIPSVKEAIFAGRITRMPDGSIDPAIADEEWAANTDPAPRKTRKQRDPIIDVEVGAKKAFTVADVRRQEAESFDVNRLGKMPYSEARALKENFAAKLAWVEVQQKLGELLDRREVADEIEKQFRVFRDAVLNIPNRVAAQVANVTEIADVQDVIASEIHAALDELSATLQRIGEGSPQ